MMFARALLPLRSRMNLQVEKDLCNVVNMRIHKDLCKRCASGRGHYIRDGSNKQVSIGSFLFVVDAMCSSLQDISEETRELLRQAKNPDEQTWKLGHGILEPVVLDLSTEERTRARQYQVDYHGRARSIFKLEPRQHSN